MTKLITIFLIILLIGTSNTAERGIVRGTVKGPDNSLLLATVDISFYPLDKPDMIEFTHAKRGKFNLVELKPGLYSFYVSSEGFQTHVQHNVKVIAGSVTELNVRLQIVGTRSDSADVFNPAQPNVDYKMKYVDPNLQKRR